MVSVPVFVIVLGHLDFEFFKQRTHAGEVDRVDGSIWEVFVMDRRIPGGLGSYHSG